MTQIVKQRTCNVLNRQHDNPDFDSDLILKKLICNILQIITNNY